MQKPPDGAGDKINEVDQTTLAQFNGLLHLANQSNEATVSACVCPEWPVDTLGLNGHPKWPMDTLGLNDYPEWLMDTLWLNFVLDLPVVDIDALQTVLDITQECYSRGVFDHGFGQPALEPLMSCSQIPGGRFPL